MGNLIGGRSIIVLSGDPPNFPALLNGYATRPPWQVAGVDYYVGLPSTKVLTDWQAVTGAGVSVDGNGVHVTGTSNVHIDGVDFSLHGGGNLYFSNSPNGLVTNCKFQSSPTDSEVQQLGTSSGFTMSNCTLTGGVDGSTLVLINAGGTVEISNCWFKNFPQHVVEINGTATFSFHHNLISNGGTVSGSHLNYSQWQGSADTLTATVQFNTSYQTLQNAGGEGYQIYTNDGTHTGTLINPTVTNNTMIAITGPPESMSYMIHGSSKYSTSTPSVTPISGAATLNNNYFDPTGANGPLYPGSFTAWSFTGNIDMTNGATITPPP